VNRSIQESSRSILPRSGLAAQRVEGIAQSTIARWREPQPARQAREQLRLLPILPQELGVALVGDRERAQLGLDQVRLPAVEAVGLQQEGEGGRKPIVAHAAHDLVPDLDGIGGEMLRRGWGFVLEQVENGGFVALTATLCHGMPRRTDFYGR